MSQLVPIGKVVEVNPTIPKTLSNLHDKLVTFLPMAAVSESGRITAPEERPIHEVIKGYRYFEQGDVLLAKITPCMENGKAAFVKDIPHSVGFGSTEFHVLRPSSQIDGQYLFYMIWNPIFRKIAEKNMTGTAGQKRVQAEFVKRYKIPLPSVQEQCRIAAILDKADAVRRKRAEAIALTEELLRSAFLEMFGDLVLFLSRGSNSRPEGWQLCKLGDQLTLQRGFDITKQQCQEGIYAVISSGGVSAYHSEYKALGPGVLLGRKGSVGKVHYVEENYWPHDTTLWVKDFKGNHPLFVYFFFKWFPISHFEASTSNPTLNRNRLHPVNVLWPPQELQKRFAAIYESVSKSRKLTQCAVSDSNNLFNSLLQKAFKGEL